MSTAYPLQDVMGQLGIISCIFQCNTIVNDNSCKDGLKYYNKGHNHELIELTLYCRRVNVFSLKTILLV